MARKYDAELIRSQSSVVLVSGEEGGAGKMGQVKFNSDEEAIRADNYSRYHPSWSEDEKNSLPWEVRDVTFANFLRLVLGRSIKGGVMGMLFRRLVYQYGAEGLILGMCALAGTAAVLMAIIAWCQS